MHSKLNCNYQMFVQGGPKVSYYHIIKNGIKSANEVAFIRQIKVSIKHCSIVCWYWLFCAWYDFWRH